MKTNYTFDTHWQLTGSYLNGRTLDATLPGDNYSALLENGVIPDPYYGKNERAVLPVYQSDWTYAQDFDVPDALLAKPYIYLVASFVDTLCDCTINGRHVFHSENMHAIYRPDVKPFLKPGKNRIAFTFPPIQPLLDQRRKDADNGYPYFVSDIDFGLNYIRKPICNGGWDWGIMLMVAGVHAPLQLIGTDNTRIDYLYVRQKHEKDLARVTAIAEIHAETQREEKVTFHFNGESQTVTANLTRGNNNVEAQFVVKNPRLWFPNGYGKQEMYTLTAETADSARTQNICLRSLELVNRPDDDGVSMVFRINGIDVFCKGANWIPCDAMPQRQTPERYEDLLESARLANMNMLRVWGGGQYEQDCFYDLCDQKGILVWQDLMFSCGIYPCNEDFIRQVALEVEHQLPRLRAHGCLALVCGDNECLGATHWFGKDRYPEYLVKYDRLNQAIAKMVRAQDLEQAFWPSSPCAGPNNLSDCWHKDNAGDMHFWDVWAQGLPFEHFYTMRPRFCSEFGYQALPSADAIRSFCPPKEQNVFSSTMMVHQKCKKGNAPIIAMFERLFYMPESLERFVYQSQLQQALAIKMAVEFWRSTRPRCMGTLFWQLNDLWPTASWSSIEYGGQWKQLQYHARRFFAPIIAAMFRNNEAQTKVCVISDLTTHKPVNVTLNKRNFKGAILAAQSWQVDLAPGESRELACWNDDQMAQDDATAVFYEVRADFDGDTFQNAYFRAPFKELQLEDATIATSVAPSGNSLEDGFDISLSTDAAALFVMLATPGIPGRFDDNSFLLLPDSPRRIHFSPRNACTLERLKAALTVEKL